MYRVDCDERCSAPKDDGGFGGNYSLRKQIKIRTTVYLAVGLSGAIVFISDPIGAEALKRKGYQFSVCSSANRLLGTENTKVLTDYICGKSLFKTILGAKPLSTRQFGQRDSVIIAVEAEFKTQGAAIVVRHQASSKPTPENASILRGVIGNEISIASLSCLGSLSRDAFRQKFGSQDARTMPGGGIQRMMTASGLDVERYDVLVPKRDDDIGEDYWVEFDEDRFRRIIFRCGR